MDGMKLHNKSNAYILVNERYMLPGVVRDVRESIAEAAIKTHPHKLIIIGRAPRVEAVREPQAEPVRDDWTKVRGIGDMKRDALYFMGIFTKADLLAYVAANGENAINDIPGMSDRKVASLIEWANE